MISAAHAEAAAMSEQLPATLQTGHALTVVDAEIAARLEQHAHDARGAFAPETLRALRKASNAFSAWASAEGRPALPADPAAVAAYVDHLAAAEPRRSAATIRQAVWAISSLHRAASLPDPTKAEVVRLALKRMAKAGTRQRQAAPIGGRELERILATAGTTFPALRNVALALVMSDMLARRSEAVALQLEDVQPNPADGSATVLIRRSKTDQEGAGVVLWLSPRTMIHLHAWITAAGITTGPIFRTVNKGGRVGEALAGGDVARILKALAAAAGINPTGVSGHSLRVGTAQDMVAAGEDSQAVMQAGRWKSPAMPARYGERLAAGRNAVARLYERNRR
jgi:integrase